MKFFLYDDANEQLILNKEMILLVNEFSVLLDEKRNKVKKGEHKERAFKEFAYIFLFLDWESPFFSEPEQDRHMLALDHSGLTEMELEDKDFRAACKRYNDLQNSSMAIRLLRAAMSSVETVIYYFEHIDVNERNESDGKPIFKTKDLINEIKGCKDLIDGLQDLENRVKKDLEPSNGVRGDSEIGMFDM